MWPCAKSWPPARPPVARSEAPLIAGLTLRQFFASLPHSRLRDAQFRRAYHGTVIWEG